MQEWLTARQLSDRVGVPERTVRGWMDLHGLPWERRPAKRCVEWGTFFQWVIDNRPWSSVTTRHFGPFRCDSANDHEGGTIYALTDPRDGAIRYIGKSKNASRRARDYRSDFAGDRAHSPSLLRWFAKLKRQGLRPKFRVLDECLFGVCSLEAKWIAKGRRRGWRLLNVGDGGQGGSWTEEAKRRQSERTKALYSNPDYVKRFREGLARRFGIMHGSPEWLERERRRQANREQNRRNMLLAAERKRLRDAVLVPLTHKGAAFVPLTKGLWAVVDVEDWPTVGHRAWHAQPYYKGHRALTKRGGRTFLHQITTPRPRWYRPYPGCVDARRTTLRIDNRPRFAWLGAS